MGGNAALAAEYARGLSEIIVALAEAPTVVTQDALSTLALLADKIAETAETPDTATFRKAA